MYLQVINNACLCGEILVVFYMSCCLFFRVLIKLYMIDMVNNKQSITVDYFLQAVCHFL